MADSALEGLNPATAPLSGDELIYGTQGGDSVRMTVDEVRGPKLKSIVDLATAAGDLLFGLGTGLLSRLPKGTAGQYLRMNAGATAPEWAAGPAFTKYSESSAQTITASGALTWAHGLGVEPKGFAIVLECLTADNGFSVGDKLFVNPNMNGQATVAQGATVVFNATNLLVRYANTATTFSVIHNSDGTRANLTNARWSLYLRAWA